MKNSTFKSAGKKLWCGCLLVLLLLVSVPMKTKAATEAELLATIAELTAIVQALRAQAGLPPLMGRVPTAVWKDMFTEPVVYGATNNSIKLLQNILRTDPLVYPTGLVSGYFGDLTKEALMTFQRNFSLPPTGTFTADTEAVLNATLNIVLLTTYSATYLQNPKVQTQITESIGELTLKDAVEDGIVVLQATPKFSVTEKTTDMATVQRILKTGGTAYRQQRVTGLLDQITIGSLVELRKKYGLSEIMSNATEPNKLFDTELVNLLRKILVANNSATIKSNLLQLPDTKPTTLILNSTRVVQRVEATRDYREKNTQVIVYYLGSVSEKFLTKVVSPNTAVVNDIASKLDRPRTDISSVIKYDSIHGDDFKKILLTVYLSTQMTIDIDYMDGKKERIDVTEREVQGFVNFVYGGNFDAYQSDFRLYVEKARRGEPIDRVFELVADIIGASKADVAEVLYFDVEKYSDTDSCSSGCSA